MPYDILSNDVLDKGNSSSNQGIPTRVINAPQRGPIMPFIVNILLLLIILASIIWLLVVIFSSDNGEEKDIVSFIGDLEYLNESYQGDLKLFSSKFLIETENGVFNDNSKDILIVNFSGNIRYGNKSMYVEGIGDEIRYGNNILRIKNIPFKLSSFKKTNIDMYFDNLSLNFEEGRIRLNENLNFQFQNASILVQDYNMSLNYDGTFSLSGTSSMFELSAPQDKLSFTYVNDRTESLEE